MQTLTGSQVSPASTIPFPQAGPVFPGGAASGVLFCAGGIVDGGASTAMGPSLPAVGRTGVASRSLAASVETPVPPEPGLVDPIAPPDPAAGELPPVSPGELGASTAPGAPPAPGAAPESEAPGRGPPSESLTLNFAHPQTI